MKRCLRFICILYRLAEFFVRAFFIRLLYKDPVIQRKRLALNTSQTGSKMLKSFGLNVTIKGQHNLEALRQNNHLVIANHVSYTDILILSSVHPFIFITSLEMAANPVLGDITRLGGSLFTNRQKHTSLPQEINNFADALSQGFDLMLFPEGTSTNGITIKEFRKSLFQTSIIAQKPILPICVRYMTLDGKPFTSQEQRDIVCWYDDMTFVPHFFNLIRHNVVAEVSILPSIPFAPEINRQQLCDKVYNQILTVFTNK